MSSSCAICLDCRSKNYASLPCGHVFHYNCINKWLAGNEFNPRISKLKAECPTCRREFRQNGIRKIFLSSQPTPAAHIITPTAPTTRKMTTSNQIKNNRLFIKYWDTNVVEKDLRDLLKAYVKGTMQINIRKQQHNNGSKGFAFVTFQNEMDANNVIKCLNGEFWRENPLHIEVAKSEMELENERRSHVVFVKNLKSTVNKEMIQFYFQSYGNIKELHLYNHGQRQTAQIKYQHPESASKVIQGVNGEMLWGSKVHVEGARKVKNNSSFYKSSLHHAQRHHGGGSISKTASAPPAFNPAVGNYSSIQHYSPAAAAPISGYRSALLTAVQQPSTSNCSSTPIYVISEAPFATTSLYPSLPTDNKKSSKTVIADDKKSKNKKKDKKSKSGCVIS